MARELRFHNDREGEITESRIVRGGGSMSTSTRLILLLTVAVSLVVGATNIYTLHRREAALKATMRSEVLAHAYTLEIALEELFAADRAADAQHLVDRLSDNPYLFRVTLFDENERVIVYSDLDTTGEESQEAEVAQAIDSGEKVEHFHNINGEDYFSVVLPVQLGANRRGAFEIAQPMSFLNREVSQARRSHLGVLIILIVVIFAVVSLVLRRTVGRPIKSLLEGTAAIGRGDLNYRLAMPAKDGEFSRLAGEFNLMADNLLAQREAARREYEQRLGLERELRHRDRLVLIGRISASVAHEMGTPLNVIDGRAAQLLDRPDSPVEMRQRNLTIIRDQARRITSVVRQLLNLARTKQTSRQPVELERAFRNVIELIEADAARNGVTIELVPGLPAWTEADENLLHQVFINICLNAIQAMPKGGVLRIDCQRDGMIKGGHRFAVARVSDTGVGIAEEHLAQIFDPFFTTKDIGQGTGLGLAVSRRIIEDSGGWIEAANRTEGMGSVFTIFLPQIEQPATDISALVAVEQEAS
jgi:signal transduction histidine kinase